MKICISFISILIYFFTPSLFAAENAMSAKPILGVVTLSPELKSAVQSGAVLYVIARKFGETSGMPIAVIRMSAPQFPQSFKLGAENMMVAGGEFKGPFTLTAKISQRGDAITHPGDLIGKTPEKFKVVPGAQAIKIHINETTR